MDRFISSISRFFGGIVLPSIGVIDIIEILLISVLIYQFIIWIQYTRTYNVLKGILVILAFLAMAYIFRMNTILWIVRSLANVLIISVVVIFQPELRKVLEQLGRKNILSAIFPIDTSRKESTGRSMEKAMNEIVKASFEMGAVKTGALIVIEKQTLLTDYVRTGIKVDGLISSQLLINIFEHNTPLHDGAVIVRGDRIVAATCYLPLSDNMALSKQLGTRHRAGVGISEVSDSITVIVSEETGAVSVAHEGELSRNLNEAQLKKILLDSQNSQSSTEQSANAKLANFIKGARKGR